MPDIEIQLLILIKSQYECVKNMHPADGLSSPRDIELAKEISKQAAIMDRLQDAMRVINPGFEIRNQHETFDITINNYVSMHRM